MAFVLNLFKQADDDTLTKMIVLTSLGAYMCMQMHNEERMLASRMRHRVIKHARQQQPGNECVYQRENPRVNSCTNELDFRASMDRTIGINERYQNLHVMSEHVRQVANAKDEEEFTRAFKPAVSKFDVKGGSVTRAGYVTPALPRLGHSDGCPVGSGTRSCCLQDRQKRRDVVSL